MGTFITKNILSLSQARTQISIAIYCCLYYVQLFGGPGWLNELGSWIT
jgi:hypothetical protein